MSYIKKCINFLFVIGLCFHSLSIMSSEFGYIPMSATEDIAQASRGASTFVFESPMLTAGSVMMILSGTLFMGRGKISDWAAKKYETLKTEVKDVGIEKKIEKNVSPQARWLMVALKPLLGGIPKYFAYNKWHMVVAAIVTCVGHVLGHPRLGSGLGGTTLTAGYFSQGFAEVRDDIKQVRDDISQLDTNNTQLHETTHKNINDLSNKADAIAENVKVLSEKMDTVKNEITDQINSLETQVKNGIKDVSTKLIDLNGKLKDVPQELLALHEKMSKIDAEVIQISQTNATIIKQNATISQKTDELSKQLTEVTEKFVSTQKRFDELGTNIVQKMNEMANNQKEGLANIQVQATAQTENLEQMKEDVCSKFEQLFENVKVNSELLKSVKNIQESYDQRFATLLNKVSDSEQHNKKITGIIDQVKEAQAKSAANCAEILQNLNSIREVNANSVDTILSQMQGIDEKLAVFDTRIMSIEGQLGIDKEKRKELKKIMTEQSKLIANLATQILGLQGQVTALREQIGENNKLAQQTNLLAQSAVQCFSSANVYVPIQQSNERGSNDKRFLPRLDAPNINNGVTGTNKSHYVFGYRPALTGFDQDTAQ